MPTLTVPGEVQETDLVLAIIDNLQPLCCNGLSVMEPQTNNTLDPTGSKIDISLLPKTMWIFIK